MSKNFDRLEILLADLKARYGADDDVVAEVQKSIDAERAISLECQRWNAGKRPAPLPRRNDRLAHSSR